jgi:hypothetical protein
MEPTTEQFNDLKLEDNKSTMNYMNIKYMAAAADYVVASVEYVQGDMYFRKYGKESVLGYVIKFQDDIDQEKTIRIGIDSNGQCCETFGVKVDVQQEIIGDLDNYYEDHRDLIGKNVSDIKWDGDSINISTDDGSVFIFTLWCDHNGYYPHDIFVEWEDYYFKGEL